jgi:hypothetical protein
MNLDEYLMTPTTFKVLHDKLMTKYNICAHLIDDREIKYIINNEHLKREFYQNLKNGEVYIIFISNGNNIGHWTTIIRHKKYIEYFDSYGLYPTPLIASLLVAIDDIEKKIHYEYSHKQLQGKDSMVCGWHVVMRAIYKNQCLKDFYKSIDKIKKEYGINNYDTLTYLF